jgi:protein-S-isoprenylcysteine O-methyltransferase Ste14
MIKFPPPIWTFLFLIAATAISAVYPWKSLLDLRLTPLGIALVALGVFSSFWAFGLFAKEKTDINPVSPTSRLVVTTGPYRFTRNPMYLGLVLFSLGVAFLVGSLPFFAVPFLVFLVANIVHIPFEEAKMRRLFGAEYDRYTDSVRRWL